MNRVVIVNPCQYDEGFFFVEIPDELDLEGVCAVLGSPEEAEGGRSRVSCHEIVGVIRDMSWYRGYAPQALRFALGAAFFYRPRSMHELVWGTHSDHPPGPEDVLVEALQEGRAPDIYVREARRWDVLTRPLALYLLRAWKTHGEEGPFEEGFAREAKRRWPEISP